MTSPFTESYDALAAVVSRLRDDLAGLAIPVFS